MELNPIEQIIAGWPLWVRLLPAIALSIPLAIGIWSTRKEVGGKK